MSDKTRIVTQAGDRIFYNWPKDGAPETVVGTRLNQCTEIEDSLRGLFFTYSEGPGVIERVKADLEVVREFILNPVPLILMLDEEDGELWLVVALPATVDLERFMKRHSERLIHHLSETVLGRS